MNLKSLILALILGLSFQAKAADEMGIGAMIGNPTGASGYLRAYEGHVIAAALAYSFSRFPGLYISGDYLWDSNYQFSIKSWAWDVYYGVGGRVIAVQSGDDKNSTAFGVRGPVGVTHVLRDPHIMFFGELVPVLTLSPRSDVGLDLGIGLRILF